MVTEDVVIPLAFTEPMDWTFRLVAPGGAIAAAASGSGSEASISWDGMIDGQAAGRSVYTIEVDAVTLDDGEVPDAGTVVARLV